MSRALLLVLAPVAAFAVLVACTDPPVVLATIPATDGGTREPPTRCLSTSDCPAGRFCDNHGCGQPGECDAYPASCADTENLVCGCDGVTYFNDCLRRAAGVGNAGAAECASLGLATPCGGATNDPCPADAVCARVLGSGRGPAGCPPDVRGTCWGLPATCPAPTTADRWDVCGAAGLRCLDTCSAIRNGEPFVRAARCF